MSYIGYRGMSRQISAHELQERAKDILADNPDFEPIKVTSKEICTSWWGKAWCKNLERYAYFEHGESRIKRGEKFVINDAVVNLQINGGNITAHVVGGSFKPFEVKIKITPMSVEKQDKIVRLAAGKIKNIEALAEGNFPEELKDSLSELIFPKADEMDFECDCPEHEYICNHISAVLYGIGVRLDAEPLLFFETRGIDADDFIWKIVGGRVEGMLKNVDKDSLRIIKGADLVAKFGVDTPKNIISIISTFPALENCPFCGHNEYEWLESTSGHLAYCTHCGAGLLAAKNREEYAKEWNAWTKIKLRRSHTGLRACPICGAFDIERHNENLWFWLRCSECGCESGGAETWSKAVQGWNQRNKHVK